MSNYIWEYIRKHPLEVKRLLGIDFDQLEQLIEQGKFLHQKKQEEKEKRKIRSHNQTGRRVYRCALAVGGRADIFLAVKIPTLMSRL